MDPLVPTWLHSKQPAMPRGRKRAVPTLYASLIKNKKGFSHLPHSSLTRSRSPANYPGGIYFKSSWTILICSLDGHQPVKTHLDSLPGSQRGATPPPRHKVPDTDHLGHSGKEEGVGIRKQAPVPTCRAWDPTPVRLRRGCQTATLVFGTLPFLSPPCGVLGSALARG